MAGDPVKTERTVLWFVPVLILIAVVIVAAAFGLLLAHLAHGGGL
jgi:cytochrome c-type biogenesis protein CcmH/NrfF